eukprot:6093308-Pleurochrysis_carterae.AAC.1
MEGPYKYHPRYSVDGIATPANWAIWFSNNKAQEQRGFIHYSPYRRLQLASSLLRDIKCVMTSTSRPVLHSHPTQARRKLKRKNAAWTTAAPALGHGDSEYIWSTSKTTAASMKSQSQVPHTAGDQGGSCAPPKASIRLFGIRMQLFNMMDITSRHSQQRTDPNEHMQTLLPNFVPHHGVFHARRPQHSTAVELKIMKHSLL